MQVSKGTSDSSQSENGASEQSVKFGSRLPALVQKWRPPRPLRLLLAEMHAFGGCRHRNLLRLARWGDVVEVHPGEVLLREDRVDHWFYAILAGSVQVTRKAQLVATLHRGDHFGEVAIIGLHPQPATVTAIEPSVLFVLGPRYLLSIAAADMSVQKALFPNATADYRAYVRELQEQGRLQWQKLIPTYPITDVDIVPRSRPVGRHLSWNEALELLSNRDVGGGAFVPIVAPLPSRRARVAALGVVAALIAGILFFYHPPVVVVTAGQPIDVVPDISITGTKVDRPTGRYLLTPVNVEGPNLAGAFVAWGQRRLILPAEAPATDEIDAEEARIAAREAFHRSHRQAIELAEKALKIDAKGVSIAIRDRGIVGPSAGLIYALAIVDMLDPDDLAAGRVIAATGELRIDGGVTPVAFVSLKAEAARGGGAVIFLVPAKQRSQVRNSQVRVVGVNDLEDAVRALKQAR